MDLEVDDFCLNGNKRCMFFNNDSDSFDFKKQCNGREGHDGECFLVCVEFLLNASQTTWSGVVEMITVPETVVCAGQADNNIYI